MSTPAAGPSLMEWSLSPKAAMRSAGAALAICLGWSVAGGRLEAAEPFIPSVPDQQPQPPFPPVPAGAGVAVLVPGFVVRELPVRLSNLNNIEYAPDGRLFAGGYDGRFHLLRDRDGDGLEEQVDTFAPATSENYPLGLAVKDGEPYAVLGDEVVRFRDRDGDGVPEFRETVHKGFDDPELAAAPYLMHRRVDSSMAISFGPDGALYVTMGNAAPTNPYWTEQGVARYQVQRRRGCLLRFGGDGKVESLATGLRYVMSLQWNGEGDLFGTDQEGATWVPNGNPYDELNHLQPGRHYGFPPQHPQWLPGVVDEPALWNYAPQHQSACGFRFNGPAAGRGRCGPGFWAGDALVTGQSRGKLGRTTLAKTAAGYVARSETFARLGMMPVDVALSPRGDLVVCCHSGAPDWGNGPQGEGKLFKISFEGAQGGPPVLTYAATATTTALVFERPGEAAAWAERAAEGRIASGHYVDAADRRETFRPGYAVVERQQKEVPRPVALRGARLSADGSSLLLESDPRSAAWRYAISLAGPGGGLEVAHDLSGVAAEWTGAAGAAWRGWLPHPDFAAARHFTRGSSGHAALWEKLASPGTLTLQAQLNPWQMLVPATQPGSQLDYGPAPETVQICFASDAAVTLRVPGFPVERISAEESRITLSGTQPDEWRAFILTLSTPARRLDVSFTTPRDGHRRPLGVGRFLMPFAVPAPAESPRPSIPEIAGGNWEAGHALFLGKAACATCHQWRGEGAQVGPDLSNLIHRDYASVRRDILDPNAAINPDAVGYVATAQDGSTAVGTRVGESSSELLLAQPGGAVARLPKSTLAKIEPMAVSLMPGGLEQALTKEELRDLMTFLLTFEPR